MLINGSQQQWYTRNSEVGTWTNAVWNQVFTGVVGAPDDAGYPDPPYTTLDTTPVSREKPYLFVDAEGEYNVRVPSAQRDTRGISWADGMTPGRTIPITDFFIADPTDSVQVINNQLARGKHLILTPGVYDVAKSISVKRADTVVLGLGLATLDAVDGAIPLTIADKPGIIVAGVTIDAGPSSRRCCSRSARRTATTACPTRTPTTRRRSATCTSASAAHTSARPTSRWRSTATTSSSTTPGCGGPTTASRASTRDASGIFGDNERWVTNIGRNGVVVNGDDVTATGLFVEHFQEYNTIWNGERGRVILYQNELPYDPPTQADWTADDGTLGWAGVQGRRRRREARVVGRRCLRVQPEQPRHRDRERLRGADDTRGRAEPRHDQEPQRPGHDQPRRQRRR